MPPSLLQIEEPKSPAPLVGIAKLAAQGESLKLGHQVEYFTLPAKALLNRCVSKRVPFDWTVNPYRGCEFACKYCYARYTHEFMEMRDGLDFERKIYVKQQTASSVASRLRSARPPIPTSLLKSASRSRAASWRNSPCITASKSALSPSRT
jgi:hypothetical protein